MTKKPLRIQQFLKIIPYFLASCVILGIVFFGSLDKSNPAASLSLATFAKESYNNVSTDQLTELYVVADLSSSFALASANDVAANYVITTTMHNAGQTASGKLGKPNIVYVSSRGVISHTVAAGETMESIAQEHKLTTDQIRWSNGLKTTKISEGDTLYLPSTPGIVYTAKAGETVEGIAEKYGSSATEIIALNDLEVSGLTEGMRIVIKNGTLPNTERPEYVAPVRQPTYSYTFIGSSQTRQNIRYVATGFYDSNYPFPNPNPGVPGWCTWYAWYWRASDPRSLGQLGHEGRNAYSWNYNYAYRGVKRGIPAAGTVFQTPYGGGGYGHVGVVLAVHGDGSITVREMNYAGRYVVTEAEIPAAEVRNLNFIY